MIFDQIFEDLQQSIVKNITKDPYPKKPERYVWLPPDVKVCKICLALKPSDIVNLRVCDRCRTANLKQKPLPPSKVQQYCVDCGASLPLGRKGGRCVECRDMARDLVRRGVQQRWTEKYRADESFRQAELERYRRYTGGRKKEVWYKQQRAELLAYYATDPLKRCPSCGEEKRLSSFERDAKRLSGAGAYCTQCSNKKRRLRKNKKYEQEAPAKLQAKIEAAQIAALLAPINAEIRKERAKELKKKYKKKNREDPVHRLHRSMSEHMRKMLRGAKRTGWRTKAGWTKDELITHLTARFQDGMTLDNYGEWHVDHIKPKARFNLTSINDPEFKECWGLDNLQPLWAKDNASKGAKYGE